MIHEQVINIRKDQPRVGCRKLKDHLADKNISVGRDRFIELMREWSLLIKPKRNYKRTTNSRHRFKKYKNLIKNKPTKGPNQVWVSDITYLRTREGFCYLSLITDQYSRKIVGHHVHPNLTHIGVLTALKMALTQKPQTKKRLTHHSDCGLQYCSDDYIALLKSHRARISMTEDNHVYENALAERVNGILKNEFLLATTWPSVHHARRAVQQAIKIYNTQRLHNSLGNKTPESIHNLN